MDTYETIYLICLILSILLCGIYVRIHSKQHDIHYLAIIILLIITNYSLYAYTQSTSVDSALETVLLYYAAITFITPVMLRINSNICKIQNKIYLDINFLIAAAIAIMILTTRMTGLFIKSFDVDITTGINSTEFGIGLVILNIYAVINLILQFSLGFMSKNRARISRRCHAFILCSVTIFFISGLLTNIIPGNFDFDSVSFVLMQAVLIILSTILPLYDVESVITESIEKYSNMGIIILDKNRNLIGYDNRIGAAIPDFRTYKIDCPLPESFYFYDVFNRLIDRVNESYESQNEVLEFNNNYYKFEMSKLLMSDRFRGYQMTVTDVTTKEKYVKLIESFNTKLEEEVNSKARQIATMQSKVIIGIAEIIESRDLSTGGHIKRTSKLVEILTDELKNEKLFNVPDKFYTYLISAAQTHDLGKVAVPDNILNKPGKFTPEEYEQMKAHAAKGGIIVSKVLSELNVPDYVELAANVAHYHHERWDGSGYPDRLSKEAIPLEARIMAIADVYDALVSKRVYKDQFDYQKAYDIIMEGMGSQFDPQLETAFKNCVHIFEAYYDKESAHCG